LQVLDVTTLSWDVDGASVGSRGAVTESAQAVSDEDATTSATTARARRDMTASEWAPSSTGRPLSQMLGTLAPRLNRGPVP